MALVRAYFDSSASEGRAGPAGVMSVCGHIGTGDKWAELEAKWRDNLKYWHLEEFHLSVLRARRTSVPSDKVELCIKSFANLIDEADIDGVGAALREADYDDWPKPKVYLDYAPTKYHAVFGQALTILNHHMRHNFPGDLVALVVDVDFKPTSVAEDMFKKMQGTPLGNHLESLSFGHARRLVPLQCADLFCGLCRMEWLDREWADRKNDNPTYEKSKGRVVTFHWWSHQAAKDRSKEYAEFRKTRS